MFKEPLCPHSNDHVDLELLLQSRLLPPLVRHVGCLLDRALEQELQQVVLVQLVAPGATVVTMDGLPTKPDFVTVRGVPHAHQVHDLIDRSHGVALLFDPGLGDSDEVVQRGTRDVELLEAPGCGCEDKCSVNAAAGVVDGRTALDHVGGVVGGFALDWGAEVHQLMDQANTV